MSAPVRIAAFAVGLALLFTAATVAGGAVDPDVDDGSGEHGMKSEESAMNGHETMSADTEALPGLATSQAGYRIVPAATAAPAGPRTPYEFTIVGPDGEPLTEYAVEHERRMHLIVVRRDFAGFQHVHPELAADGTWSVAIDTRLPGTYRVFADFTTADAESMTLGTDLSVPGRADPKPLPMPEPAADAGDGYEVTLASAEPEAGTATRLEFTVSRDGRPIERVQPYLGADGHLVVLREGDLAFLHAHPQGEPGGAGPIGVRRRLPIGRCLPPVPAVPPRRCGPHGRVHRARRGPGATSVAGHNGTEANHGH